MDEVGQTSAQFQYSEKLKFSHFNHLISIVTRMCTSTPRPSTQTKFLKIKIKQICTMQLVHIKKAWITWIKGLNYSQKAAASGDKVPQTPYDYHVLYFSKL